MTEADLVAVTEEQFFAYVKAATVNIHPRSLPDRSDWEVIDTRRLIGRSYPGWRSAYGTPEKYELTRAALASLQS